MSVYAPFPLDHSNGLCSVQNAAKLVDARPEENIELYYSVFVSTYDITT